MGDIQRQICDKLQEIEKQHGVRILYAVESGSRAWGFASPDSDYDVRFIYVRPMEDYLRIDELRDVIEWQMDDVFDINGWDLKKTLKQFAKGNATLFEWSNSPVIYKTTDTWQEIYQTAKDFFSEKTAIGHYYGTANKTYLEYLTAECVRYKKYFYAIRPLFAANYIEKHHRIPPVLFEELMLEDIDSGLREAIYELLDKKKSTAEGDLTPRIPMLQEYIDGELKRQKVIVEQVPDDHNPDRAKLDKCFLDVVLSSESGKQMEFTSSVIS